MTIIEQLRKAIQAYDGPLPPTGDSIKEQWFRQAIAQLRALEAQQ
jgi:hypothetical protein